MHQQARNIPTVQPEALPSKRRRFLKVMRWMIYLGIALLLLVIGLGAVAQTSWGQEQVRQIIEHQVNATLADGRVEIGRIEGNLLSHVRAHDVRLIQRDGTTLEVPVVEAWYSLSALLRKTIHLRTLDLTRPVLVMAEDAAHNWNLGKLLPVSEDTTASAWVFQVDDGRITVGDLAIRYYKPDGDSTVHGADVNLAIRDLHYGPEAFRMRVDTLAGLLQMPLEMDALQVDAAGTLDGLQLDLDTLRAVSTRSTLYAGGLMVWPSGEATAANEFAIRAAPLDFRDVAALVPGLAPGGRVTGTVQVHGEGRDVITRADLAFTDGGSVMLEGRLTPVPEGPVRYNVQGQISQLNPAYFTANPGHTGQLQGDVEVDLAGPRLEALDGMARIRLRDAQWRGQVLPDNVFAATFDEGRATLSLIGGGFGGEVQINGTARPFDEVPTYNLSGRFRDLAPAPWMPDSPEMLSEAVLNGTFVLQGTGLDIQDGTSDGTIRLAGTRWQQAVVDSGAVGLRLRNGRLAFDTALDLRQGAARQAGRLAAQGSVDFLGRALQYQVDVGTFNNLDVAALTGDATQDSDLTGTFTVVGTGTDPLQMTLDAGVRLEAGRYQTYAISMGEAEARVTSGTLGFEVLAALEAGSISTAGTVRPFDPAIDLRLTQGTFSDVDIGVLTDDPTQQSTLNGTFTGFGTGPSLPELTLSFDLEVLPSQYNEQVIQGGGVTIRLRDERAEFNGALDFPEGELTLVGFGTPFAEVPAYSISQGIFRRLDLGAVLGNPQLTSDLNGWCNVQGLGFEPNTAAVTASCTLIPSRLNGESLSTGRATVTLREGSMRVDGAVNVAQGRIMLVGEGRLFDEVITYEALGQLTNVDAAALAGIDTVATRLNVGFSIAGRGTDPATMDMAGAVDVRGSRVDAVQVDSLQAVFNYAGGQLAVDTLFIESNVADAFGEGRIAFYEAEGAAPSDFKGQLAVKSMTPLRRLIGAEELAGEGLMDVHVRGIPGRPRFEIEPQLRYLAYDGLHVSGVEGLMLGEYREALRWETTLVLGYTSMPGFALERQQIQFSYSPERIGFEGEVRMSRYRNASYSGYIDRSSTPQAVVFEALNMRLDEHRWELSQDARITMEDKYYIRNFLLFSGDQQIAVDGEIDFDGEQNLVMTVEQFQTGALADILGYTGLDGVLEGYLIMSGSAASPTIEGSLGMRDVTSNGRPVGAFQSELSYSDFRLNIDGRVIDNGETTGTIKGYIPMNLALTGSGELMRPGDVQVAIRADDFALRLIEPFLDPLLVNRLDGRVVAEVNIDGTFSEPNLSGDVEIREGLIGLPAFEIVYNNIEGTATLSGRNANLSALTLRSGEGSMTATGTLAFTQLTEADLDLVLKANNFRAIWTETYQAAIGGDMALKGNTRQAELSGKLRFGPADIFLTEELTAEVLEPVQLTQRDLQILEERFGYRVSEVDTTTFDFYTEMKMDLDVEIMRNVWLRSSASPEMNVEFDGTLEMDKASGSLDPVLFGNIDVNAKRSYIRQFGKRFDIQSGQLIFNGPIEEAYIDSINARYRVPSRTDIGGDEVQIELVIKGREEDLSLTYRALDGNGQPFNPPMPIIDIVSYITFNRPAGADMFGSSSDLALEAVAAQVSNLIALYAGSRLGLDVVQIDNDGLDGATITVGKYVSPDLYASWRQPVVLSSSNQTADGSQQPEVSLEYRMFDWMLFRLAYRNDALRFNLLWEYAF